MAFDQQLAGRIRAHLADQPAVDEVKMFGGLAFMVQGHMCCGVLGDELMARVGAGQHAEALALPGARPMDFTGRPMKGMLMVGRDATATEEGLGMWVARCVANARSLAPKEKRPAT